MTQEQRDIAQKVKVFADSLCVNASHAAAERVTEATMTTLLNSAAADLTTLAADFEAATEPPPEEP